MDPLHRRISFFPIFLLSLRQKKKTYFDLLLIEATHYSSILLPLFTDSLSLSLYSSESSFLNRVCCTLLPSTNHHYPLSITFSFVFLQYPTLLVNLPINIVIYMRKRSSSVPKSVELLLNKVF